MLKTLSIAALAGLMLTGTAMADEYLETTGNRNAPQATQGVYLQQRAPARHESFRDHYNQAPTTVYAPAPRQQDFPRTDPLIGSGG